MTCSDIVIMGGGAIGLATAIELAQRGHQVTVLSRSHREGAIHAAAGMLAPQAEQLAPGPMLELCLRSRALYPAWIQKLEELTGRTAGYWPCGILAPSYEGAPAPISESPPASMLSQWLDQAAILEQQPGLAAAVKGGWWYPDDAQVDNRALAKVLWAAAETLGVTLEEGVQVNEIVRNCDRISYLNTSAGRRQGQQYLLATGAWSADILPVPVFPRKGQLLAVQGPPSPHTPLQQVLFGPDIYIVPRRNGKIILGATSEDVGFATGNTPAGIQQLLNAAIRLFPPLQDYAIDEFWWGYRPTTPDECPILGQSPYENLIVATGHYRNGILLTPITATVIAELVSDGRVDPLLPSFSWQRFADPAVLATPQAVTSGI